MIRVMIADDHQLFAEGLSQALNILPDTRVVGVVDSGAALAEALMVAPILAARSRNARRDRPIPRIAWFGT